MASFFEWLTREVANNFGSKKGFVKFIINQVKLYLGAYREYENVDFNKVNRFVFVCHGNICRSALADAVANSLGFESISCGVNVSSEVSADPRAVKFAVENGLDLSEHKSKNIDTIRFLPGDLVVAMEPEQLYVVAKYKGDAQVTLLGMWLKTPIAYVHDPYSASQYFFKKCMVDIFFAVKKMCAEKAAFAVKK